ncbi:MAG: hypothetical protein H7Y36_05110 [Armatimonadetes bacterium]|nr:hypothetical protein [Akkermansiaceae bacterium]
MKRGGKISALLLLAGLVVWVATREPKVPAYPRWKPEEKELGRAQDDVELVKALLREGLSDRVFDFSVVAEAVSGKKVLPVAGRESGPRVVDAIKQALEEVMGEMNGEDSPIRGLRRINEGSRFFEDGLRERLNRAAGIRCEIPKTRGGLEQRSGYPDLKITDEATGEVYYLDPKLMEVGSGGSSLRTFYFEPKDETLKIKDHATHLLVGIEHDGNEGEWRFLRWKLVDLSALKVRLKAEFQASNRNIYGEGSVLEKGGREGKDGAR